MAQPQTSSDRVLFVEECFCVGNDLSDRGEMSEPASSKEFSALTASSFSFARVILVRPITVRGGTYPWESPEKDLADAERLIKECGYHRRDEELADAKRFLLGRE